MKSPTHKICGQLFGAVVLLLILGDAEAQQTPEPESQVAGKAAAPRPKPYRPRRYVPPPAQKEPGFFTQAMRSVGLFEEPPPPPKVARPWRRQASTRTQPESVSQVASAKASAKTAPPKTAPELQTARAEPSAKSAPEAPAPRPYRPVLRTPPPVEEPGFFTRAMRAVGLVEAPPPPPKTQLPRRRRVATAAPPPRTRPLPPKSAPPAVRPPRPSSGRTRWGIVLAGALGVLGLGGAVVWRRARRGGRLSLRPDPLAEHRARWRAGLAKEGRR